MASSLPIADPWPKDNRLAVGCDAKQSFHAYVHIPFCVVRCGYCDFNTYIASEIGEISRDQFHNHLISEIQFSSQVLQINGQPKRPFSTVFFGGGTPSLFSPQQIGQILNSLEKHFGFTSEVEITMEANPEGLSFESILGFKQAGINRLSLGVQSFDPDVLKVLDRVHTDQKVVEAATAAKQNDLRLSLDLIYGAPGETLESWKATLERAIELTPEHISAYSLIVEEGTAIARRIARGELADVDEDLNADKYVLAESMLTAMGLNNYEVSNWGEPSRHNVAYWESRDWWGYGPGAHSHLAGARFWNQKHPATYAAKLSSGSPAHSIEYVDRESRLEERLLLELRTSKGVEVKLFRELGVDQTKVAQAIADGKLVITGNQRIAATTQGRLVIDGLILDFLTK